jgi:hypothetical protein
MAANILTRFQQSIEPSHENATPSPTKSIISYHSVDSAKPPFEDLFMCFVMALMTRKSGVLVQCATENTAHVAEWIDNVLHYCFDIS